MTTLPTNFSHPLVEVYRLLLEAAKRKEQLSSSIESSIQKPVILAEGVKQVEMANIDFANSNFEKETDTGEGLRLP